MRKLAIPAAVLLSALVLIAAAPAVKASYLWGVPATCSVTFAETGGPSGVSQYCTVPNITVPSDCANITSDVMVMSSFIGMCNPFSYNYLIAEFTDSPFHYQYNLQSCPNRFESETYEYFPAAGGYKSFAAGGVYPVSTQAASLSVAAAVWCARTGSDFLVDGSFSGTREVDGSLLLPWAASGTMTLDTPCESNGVETGGNCISFQTYPGGRLNQTFQMPDINTLATVAMNVSVTGCSGPEEYKLCRFRAYLNDYFGNSTDLLYAVWDGDNHSVTVDMSENFNLDIYADKWVTLYINASTIGGGSFIYLKNVSITAGYDQPVFCGDGTCNGIESSSSCAMDCGSVTTTTTLPGTPTTTTTLATALTPAFDFLGEMLGTTGSNAKMLIWVVISLATTIGVAVYSKKSNWQLLAIIFLSLLGVGVVIGWVAAWIGIALIVFSVVGIIGKFK